jgi:hypothetical protein
MDMTVKNMNGSRHQLNQKGRSAPSASADRDTSHQRRMNSLSERTLIRTLHLVLSIPIIGLAASGYGKSRACYDGSAPDAKLPKVPRFAIRRDPDSALRLLDA